jgi:hypothetical protein
MGIHDALRLDMPFLIVSAQGVVAVHYPRSRSSRRRLQQPQQPHQTRRRI